MRISKCEFRVLELPQFAIRNSQFAFRNKLKTRTIYAEIARVRLNHLEVYSTDKHLVLSVGLINGLRHWRYEDLEAAAEARHNRGQLARRFYHLGLNEISRQSHLLVCAVDCSTHH